MYTILVIDDHPIFQQAIEMVIAEKFPDSKTLTSSSFAEGKEILSRESSINLVLLDLNMPETSGLSGLLEMRNDFPDVPVVIISAEADKQQILKTISYGAVGFISKSSSVDEIKNSIESVFAGNVCLPSNLIRMANNRQKASSESQIPKEKIRNLTRKELITLKYLSQGLANKVIAYEMDISEATVKSHVSSILKKLNVSSRVKVVAGVSNFDFSQLA